MVLWRVKTDMMLMGSGGEAPQAIAGATGAAGGREVDAGGGDAEARG